MWSEGRPVVLVSGATGDIGGLVVRGLSSSGIVDVRAPVRDVSKAAALGLCDLPHVDVVAADLSDPAHVDAAVSGVDRFFHLTPALEGQGGSELGILWINAAVKHRVQHVVKLSAAAADHSPGDHARQDAHLCSSGLPYTLLHASAFMENFLLHAASIRTRGTWLGAFNDAHYCPIAAADIAAAAVQCLLSPTSHLNRAYVLTGPQSLTNDEIAAILSRVLGKPVTYSNLTPDAYRAALTARGLEAWRVEALVRLAQFVSTGAVSRVDPASAQLLGRAPVDFETWLTAHRAAFV